MICSLPRYEKKKKKTPFLRFPFLDAYQNMGFLKNGLCLHAL